MRKFYFPLYPNKNGGYRAKKNLATIYIEADNSGGFLGAAAYHNKEIKLLDTPKEVSNFIINLPSSTWIITYNLSNWTSCFETFIHTFNYIGGVGKDSLILDLKFNNKKYNIIDVFQFYALSLSDAIQRMTGLRIYNVTPNVNAVFIDLLWSKLVEIYKDEFNIYPSKTPGATAIKIFRRFMKIPIMASGLQAIKLTTAAIRPPALHWRPGIYDEAYLYDINAAYPHVMRTMKYPKRLRLFCNHAPPSNRWIATVKLNFQCHTPFSPLSVRLKADNRVSPAKADNLIVSLTYIDLQTLELCGDVKILSWIEGVYWTPDDEEDYFSEWAAAIEAASLASPQNKLCLKIVSRALHSKFSQRHTYIHTEIFKTTPKEVKQLTKSGKVAEVYPLDNGEIAIKKITIKRAGFKPFERPDWEALTLAMCRYMMYSSINQDTIYTNTDCIISTTPRLDLPLGVKFGEWKHKGSGAAYIAGLGLYVIGDTQGTTGLKASKAEARGAIQSAAAGLDKLINTLCYPGFLSSGQSGEMNFTVRYQPYPYAIVNGARAWVTRSPTRIIPIKTDHRLITSGEKEWSLHL
jgi:hypothetical protein